MFVCTGVYGSIQLGLEYSMADSLLRVTVHNCKVIFLFFSLTHTCASTCVTDQNNRTRIELHGFTG